MQQKFNGYFERSINLNLYFLLVSCPTESLKVKKTFSAYMEEHANLRTVCEEGKGKLQWERDIPQDDLGNYLYIFSFGHNAFLVKLRCYCEKNTKFEKNWSLIRKPELYRGSI